MNFLHILRKFGFIFFALSLSVHSGFSSLDAHFQELGQSYISIYLPAPYRYVHKYNSIVQDNEGFLYVGTENGVLRFDGIGWGIIPAAGKVSLTSSGTAVLAAQSHGLSCLERGADGSPVYNPIPGIDGISGNILRVLQTGKALYILTSNALYHWENQLRQIKLSFLPEGIFLDGETLILYSGSYGLMRLEGDKALPWIPSYQIPLETVTAMQRCGEKWILIDGHENATAVFNMGAVTRGFGKIDQVLKFGIFSSIQILPDGNLAWGTLNLGLIITNPQGEVLLSLGQDEGLYDNTVKDLLTDAAENLWVLHNHAISRVEIPSSFSFFDDTRGLKGNIKDIIRFDGTLYAAGNEGLYRLDSYPAGDAGLPGIYRFRRVPGIPDDCRQLLLAGESLLVATSEGIYDVKNNPPRRISPKAVTAISYSAGHNILISASGMELFMFEGNAFSEPIKLSGTDCPIHRIIITDEGYIWLSSNSGDLYVSKEIIDSDIPPVFNRLEKSANPPNSQFPSQPFLHAGEIRFASNRVYSYDLQTRDFLADPLIKQYGITGEECINEINEGPDGSLWISVVNSGTGSNEIYFSQKGVDGLRPWQSVQFRRISRYVINKIYPENDGVTWMGSNAGVLRFDRAITIKTNPEIKTHISEVLLADDSVLDYEHIRSEAFTSKHKKGLLRLSHAKNSIGFHYQSTDYNSDAHPLFQFRIEGLQEEWSDWSENAYARISSLPRGKFTFTVRSRDNFGTVSESDSFQFRIMPPFYASLWAFFFYAIVVVIVLYAFQKWRNFQNVRDRYKLEKIIEERTEALVEEKEKTENLLANILPKATSDELMAKGKATSSKFKMVTVLFSDIQGFTKIAEQMNPDMLIDELDRFYFQFDTVVEKYNIEKVKTIGDAYMAAGGIPIKNRTNPLDVVLAALEMQHFMAELKKTKTDIWDLRIGIHTGSVIAGVVGQKKLSYDIWGDSVNTASRMESSGEVGKVNISATTYELVKNFFECEYRGKMPVKYKGDIEMYFVTGIKPDYAKEDKLSPNDDFLTQIQLLRLLDLEEYVYQRLDSELPENLFFHDVQHTTHVYTQVELLGRGEKVSEEDLLLLRSAALLHDIGYIDKFDDHEERSVEMAREILPMYRYTQEQADRICKLILATKLPPEPGNLLEQIMVDANMDHLGRVDFLIQSDKLYQEYRMQNKIKSKKDWNNYQIDFLKKYEFHTNIAKTLREVSSEQQIENIKQFS